MKLREKRKTRNGFSQQERKIVERYEGWVGREGREG